MFSTVFLCGAVTLLCLIAVSLTAYKYKLSSHVRSRHLGLQRFFFALGFLPMAIFTFSSLRNGNPVLFDLLTILRNPVWALELTAAQAWEISFLMDFITAVLLTTVAAVAMNGASVSHNYEQSEYRASRECKSLLSHQKSASRATLVPYLEYSCYIS